jgi:pSer/pThr/pTyr-binding forkhead associated (FHA) protein
VGASITELVISRGQRAGARFAVTSDRTTIGRSRDCDIVLDDVTVSRRHARIVRDGECYTLEDVGSLNGTHLNREKVGQARLADGDEVQIGVFRLTVWLSTAARQESPGRA